MFSHNPRITCNDGFSISVQAHAGSYCTRDDSGTPIKVECGFPSTTPKTAELRSYAEGYDGTDYTNPVHEYVNNTDYTNTVYGYVPVEVVRAELDAHGGIAFGRLPS